MSTLSMNPLPMSASLMSPFAGHRVPMPRTPAAFAIAVLLCLLFCMSPLHAQNRAYLSRDQVAMDQGVTLTIETDDVMFGPPDVSALTQDFQVLDVVSQPQVSVVNGQMSMRVDIVLQLQPRRQGWIEIRPFRVGNRMVGPLRLFVTPPLAAPPPEPVPLPSAAPGEAPPVMLQSSMDSGPVYVQQSVGYVVRLYYDGTRLFEGELEQPPPSGASLLRVGDDIETQRVIDGRPYKVIERRFLLVPNRPGKIVVPGPKFEGQGFASLFDDILGGGGGARRTIGGSAEAHNVQALPIPANAPQPWLPVRSVRLRYLAAERAPRVGEAAKVTVELTVDGANAQLLPELQLQVDGDAQIFPEPPQTREDFVGDRPRSVMVRDFSILPRAPGALRIVAPRIAWWDVQAGVARTASLPDLRMDVTPASGLTAPAPVAAPAAGNGAFEKIRGDWMPRFGDIVDGPTPLTILAVLWTILLAWIGWLWSRHRRGVRTARPVRTAQVARGYDAFAYKRLFDSGTFVEIAAALCAMAQPAAKDLDHLRTLLDDPAQRAAIDALQRARWSDGSITETRAQLRSAFAQGPRWRRDTRPRAPAVLPPLYPET